MVMARAYFFWLIVRTIICYSLTFVLAIVTFIPTMIIAFVLPESRRLRSPLLFWFLHASYWSVCRGFFLDIEVVGSENIPHEPAVIVANHGSALDIPVLGCVVRGHHIWYALNRFFSTPVLGPLLRRIAVSVDQERPVSAARALIRGAGIARTYRLHSLIFPEGGRYLDGVHPFFGGFAVLARKLHSPVIPVMLYNVEKVYPPHSVIIYPHPIRVVIGAPFVRDQDETDEHFVQRIYTWFKEHERNQ